MYRCENCGAECRFDIERQTLRCPSCGTERLPAEAVGLQTADVSEMDVTLHVCPNCGGTIYSDGGSVNAFCSFCGSNLMLEEHAGKVRPPRFIAPFRITKENCKQSYREYVKKIPFVPDELKSADYLENFRGIYMPYWGYDVTLKGYLCLDGVRRFQDRHGKTEAHYKCSGHLHAVREGIFFDASSTFDDHFSAQISDYAPQELVPYHPAYFSGFYADIADVDDYIYVEEAERLVERKVIEASDLRKFFPGVRFEAQQMSYFRSGFDSAIRNIYSVLLPVWFLVCRRDNRVAYAVVNGQNGHLVSDLPVDKRKYILSSLLLACPLLFLLQLLPEMKPETVVLLSAGLSAISSMLLMLVTKRLCFRDKHLDDKGYLRRNDPNGYQLYVRMKRFRKWGFDIVQETLIFIAILFVMTLPQAWVIIYGFLHIDVEVPGRVMLGFALALARVDLKENNYILMYARRGDSLLLASVWIIFGIFAYATYVMLYRPGDLLEYRIAEVLLLGSTVFTQMLALGQYNRLTTRPFPQIKRKGGEM